MPGMHRLLLGALLSLLLGSCGSKDPAPAATGASPKGAASGPAQLPGSEPVDVANTFCPVMKVVKGKDEETKPDMFVIHDGKKIRLCCKDCIPVFQENPARFMAALPAKDR